MIRLANVLLVDSNHARADALARRLAKLGFHAAAAETGADGRRAIEIEQPDMILVGKPGDGDALALASAFKASTGAVPVLLVVDAFDRDLTLAAFAAGLDDILPAGCDDTELAAHLRPLGRLATMFSELRHRAAVAGRFGISARERVAAPKERPAVLIVGDRPAEVRSVLDADADITVTGSLYEAEDLLTRTNFDAAVLSFESDPPGMAGFCSQVRNNPRLFNLPLLAVTTAPSVDLLRNGATRVVAPDEDSQVLRAAALTLVHRQQLRWSIRGALNDSLSGPGRDEGTGAYTRPFLDSYLEDRLASALMFNRHLAVAFFAAPSVEGVRAQFGEDAANHLTQQLAQWIGGLVRAEDLTARYAEHEFCVVLPDTPLAEAEVVMHRIAGVLAYTDFAVREVYQPVKLWVQVGATDAQAGDTVASLTARARQSLG